MQNKVNLLTPEALLMLRTIAKEGSFAAAARKLGLVPSALTYRVRRIEENLDALLFDRSSKQAKATAAGQELLKEGQRLLVEMDALANRVKRIATGWESQITIAVDTIIPKTVVMDLCQKFLSSDPPTRLRIRDEALSGTLQALVTGQADLAIGIPGEALSKATGMHHEAIGQIDFTYVVAPQHPLARAPEPLSSEQLTAYRAISVADSVIQGDGVTIGLIQGQNVLTVPTMADKLQAQLRGLGGGFLPTTLSKPYIDAGLLIQKTVSQPQRRALVHYAWQKANAQTGQALAWWLRQLENTATRQALIGSGMSD